MLVTDLNWLINNSAGISLCLSVCPAVSSASKHARTPDRARFIPGDVDGRLSAHLWHLTPFSTSTSYDGNDTPTSAVSPACFRPLSSLLFRSLYSRLLILSFLLLMSYKGTTKRFICFLGPFLYRASSISPTFYILMNNI